MANPRHESFCQSAAGNSDAEAYRLCGAKGKPADARKRAAEIRAKQRITKRITAICVEASNVNKSSKNKAMQWLAEIAEDSDSSERTADRIAAMKVVGGWCGWETGSEADNRLATAAAKTSNERNLLFGGGVIGGIRNGE